MAFTFKSLLPTPELIKAEFPLSDEAVELKEKRDKEIAAVFTGESDKFLVIIGPCSADREDSVCEYMERLARVSEKVSDKLILIPRVYTNKPRTTGGGYKGMLHQPNPEKKPNMYEGLVAIRKLHMRAIQDYGFSTADEMLYPENYSYLSDVLSYIAIGARSVENQQHRLTSSGVDVPVGMKNPTGGDLGVMLNAVYAAQHGHDFIYRHHGGDHRWKSPGPHDPPGSGQQAWPMHPQLPLRGSGAAFTALRRAGAGESGLYRGCQPLQLQ